MHQVRKRPEVVASSFFPLLFRFNYQNSVAIQISSIIRGSCVNDLNYGISVSDRASTIGVCMFDLFAHTWIDSNGFYVCVCVAG